MHFLEMSCAWGFTSGSCFPSSKPPGSRVMWGMCVPSLWRIEAAYSLIFSQMVWMSPSPSLSSASTCDPSTFLLWQFAASLYKSQVVHGKNDMVKIFLTSTLRSFFSLGFVFFLLLLFLCYLSHWRCCPLWDFPITASCSCSYDFTSSHNSVIGSHCHSNHPVAQPVSVGHLSLFFGRGKKSHFKNTCSHIYI